MAVLPARFADTGNIPGLDLVNRGKVRDSYRIPGREGFMAVRVTDRISIFDFVLNAEVPQKGAILNAMSFFWQGVLSSLFETDLVAAGSAIDAFLPDELRNNPDLWARMTIVDELDMDDGEMIVRGNLTGSGLADYRERGEVGGHCLPLDLQDGDALPWPLFTPSTKAKVGHDVNITADEICRLYGPDPERLALRAFERVSEFARARGILLADTKLEFGRDKNGRRKIADERFTPDSSRFWDLHTWEQSRVSHTRKAPPAWDKQFVRNAGIEAGVERRPDGKKRQPENAEDRAFVHGWELPEELRIATTRIYREIFWRLTGLKLEAFQYRYFDIQPAKPQRVEIVLGSESDLPQTEDGLNLLREWRTQGLVDPHLNYISCHRNPSALRQYASQLAGSPDVIVIAGAGLAAALPGVLKALLVENGVPQIPVIGVAFSGKDELETKAASMSIEYLPSKPVVLNAKGVPYIGAGGFYQACRDTIERELPAQVAPKTREAKFNVPF